MGIFGRSRDAPRKEKRTAPSKEMQEFIRGVDVDFIGNSNSGINVDEMRAMQTSAVYACVKILAETIASLPLHLFKKGKGGKNEMAEQHPLFSCLYEFPNEEMTSFEFRETMMTSLLLWGNAYARIIRKQGHTTELWYLKPNQMVVERDSTTGKIKYTYSDEITNKTYVYRPDQIFHIKAMSIDGVKGLSPIAQAREAVGLALATEEYGAKFFANGAAPSGVLERPGTIKDPSRVRESWQSTFGGSANANKVAVLEEGMKYTPISISPNEAQFLETRKFQIDEIARIFRVPPHMVGDLEKSSFSNIEQQSLEFVKYTLDPWVARWEQAMVRALLTQEEKKTYFFKFNVDGLLRGDYQSRMNGYATARQNGWMSANDIRELENLDRIPEEAGGDLYLINGNMTKLADAGIFAAGASESTASEPEDTGQSRDKPSEQRKRGYS